MSLLLDGTNGVTFNDASLQAAASSPYVLKNRIINGAMQIDQRNAGASLTASVVGTNTYTVDRWSYYAGQASKFTVQQNAGSITSPIGFSNYLGVTSSSAYSVTATDIFLLRQAIEGFNFADLSWGTANAKTITLSFQVYSSLTGTFSGSLNNSAANRFYPFSFTISSANTWTQISVTITGDTAGTWIGSTNGIGCWVNFNLGTGTTYSGTAGAWSGSTFYSATGATSVVGTNGATFYITGVQLEIGTSATPFERRLYGQELANCQRYLPSAVTPNYYTGVSTTTTNAYVPIPLTVTTRVAPTGITLASGTYYWLNGSGSQIVASSVIFNSAGTQTAMLQITTAGSLTAGQSGLFNPNGASILFTGCEL